MANRGHYSSPKHFMRRVKKKLKRLDNLKEKEEKALSDAGQIKRFPDADTFMQQPAGLSGSLSAYDRTVRPRDTTVYTPSGLLNRAYIINKAEELMKSQGYVNPSDIAEGSRYVAHILGSEYKQHG